MKYNLIHQKENFENVVEFFKQMVSPLTKDVVGPSTNVRIYDVLRSHGRDTISRKVRDPVSLMFNLLGDILDDEGTIWNIKKVIHTMNGVVEIDEEICAPLLERTNKFVNKWRKKRIG